VESRYTKVRRWKLELSNSTRTSPTFKCLLDSQGYSISAVDLNLSREFRVEAGQKLQQTHGTVTKRYDFKRNRRDWCAAVLRKIF
jgi:hypothetical protein